MQHVVADIVRGGSALDLGRGLRSSQSAGVVVVDVVGSVIVRGELPCTGRSYRFYVPSLFSILPVLACEWSVMCVSFGALLAIESVCEVWPDLFMVGSLIVLLVWFLSEAVAHALVSCIAGLLIILSWLPCSCS